MKKILLVGLSLLMACPTFAKIKLPALVGSNMVLQREREVNLWGEASPSKKVTVTTSWDGRKYATQSDSDGKWLLKVSTPAAGGPYTIRISDGDPVTLENVMIGEVWICSGQSNMQMPVEGLPGQPTEGANEAMLRSRLYRDVRLFGVPRTESAEPRDSCGGAWSVSSSQSVASFSAAGYFFGCSLHDALGVPIGLIEADWGGTRIETWMTASAACRVDPQILETDAAFDDYNKTSFLFNAMIYPLRRLTARGFIWYQGESNIDTGNYPLYARFMEEMVAEWRSLWGDSSMSFYYVQLAPEHYRDVNDIVLPLMVEQQLAAMDRIPNCGMISTTDVGHAVAVHPAPKREIGERLALWALSRTYGLKGLVVQSPRYESVRFGNGEAVVRFRTDGTLGPVYGGRIEGFEIAGADRVFVPAEAEYLPGGCEVVVRSVRVPEPVAVRYAFRNVPRAATLTNTGGLPAYPFRTDNWNDVK